MKGKKFTSIKYDAWRFDNVYSTLAKELGEKEALALEQAKQSLFAYLKINQLISLKLHIYF